MTAASPPALLAAAPETTRAVDELPRVLCVDDDLNLLAGLRRVLGSRYELETATNSADALVALQYAGPFAVVVADFNLGGPDGITLLKSIREIAPATVRMLFTGQATMEDAITAINDGQIFGYIRKPCRGDALMRRIDDAIAQHRLIIAEQELLQRTLHGCISALADLLAISSPAAYGRATRLKRYAGDLAGVLKAERWEVEIAALMSQIGCAALSEETIGKLCGGAELSRTEQEAADRLPQIAEQVLEHVPRLEGVRAILKYLNASFDGRGSADGVKGEQLPIGARILKVAADFDALDCRGVPLKSALDQLASRRGTYDPAVLAALDDHAKFIGAELESMELPLSKLELGMVLIRDAYSPTGILLIARGQEVTTTLLQRIENRWASFADRYLVRVVVRTHR
jgi:response regulator RpfG family c-di-GMP phosphodiesterase